MTVTVMIQLELGAMVPLLIVTDVPPAAAVSVGDPHPEVVGFGGLARKTLAGRLSVIEAWVRLLPCSLFVITMESSLVSPAHIVPGLKLLSTEGIGDAVTFNVALAGVVLVMLTPPPVEVSAFIGIVLMRLPAVVEVTFTDTVQLPGVVPTCAGTVPPLNEKDVAPAVAVTEPPHVFVRPTELAMLRPGWTLTKLSVHAAFVN